MIALKLVLGGLGLGFLLYLICAIGIRNGAVGMVHLYDQKVQERVVQLGLSTADEIRKRSVLFRSLCLPGYLIYVLICVYVINGARGFFEGFWQGFVILFIMNLIDRFLIDEYWVGHTKAWIIPGTEDLMPYIPRKTMIGKWVGCLVGFPLIAAILADGAAPAETPVMTFDNGTATINTETCAALGLDFEAISQAFAPYCTRVQGIETAESF